MWRFAPQGNMQRCKLVMDQVTEARDTMMKVLDHKDKVLKLLNKNGAVKKSSKLKRKERAWGASCLPPSPQSFRSGVWTWCYDSPAYNHSQPLSVALGGGLTEETGRLREGGGGPGRNRFSSMIQCTKWAWYITGCIRAANWTAVSPFFFPSLYYYYFLFGLIFRPFLLT